MRKYLAYSLDVQVPDSSPALRKKRSVEYLDSMFGEHAQSRLRRDANNTQPQQAQAGGVQEFQIGDQSECKEPQNPDIPCNGPPLDPNVSYR